MRCPRAIRGHTVENLRVGTGGDATIEAAAAAPRAHLARRRHTADAPIWIGGEAGAGIVGAAKRRRRRGGRAR